MAWRHGYRWFLGLGLLWGGANTDAEVFSEYELKAEFLYRFGQFATWPKPPTERFTLCLYGSDPFDGRLATFEGKSLNKLPVSIRYPTTLETAKQCQVLFLNPKPATELATWVQALADVPVLTVSDLPNAWADGAGIVLVTEPNRVSFRINLTAVRRAGLTLSSHLMKLASDIK